MSAGRFDVRCAICGKPSAATATPETLAPAPASVYASTKLMQEHLLQQRCEHLGIDLRTVRYQNVYGPGQSLSNPYTGVLAIFSSIIARGERLNLFEDATISRDFVFIDDVIELTLRVVDHPAPVGGAVNIGSGVSSSLIDVVRAFEAAFGREVLFEITGDFRYGDIRHAWADTSRLTKLLGPHEFVDLPTGIRMLVNALGDDSQAVLRTSRK
jgi:dTDP-L-rhamnose 4-epimerase